MLTVFLRFRGRIVYLHVFENHHEAIDHFTKIQVDAWLDIDVELGLTNDTVIPLGEPAPIFYVL